MPCYSRVTKTQMTEAARVGTAMAALGYTNIDTDEQIVRAQKDGRYMAFNRFGEKNFATSNQDTDAVNAIRRKYTELTVRRFARERGFSVASNDGKTMTLINRRA